MARNKKHIKGDQAELIAKEYFIKKPNLLKIIKKYPEIKENLPKEYNKLSKDKICEELYKL